MLKTTLNKMKDRIDKANKQWENENDTNLIQKFKEIVDNGQDKQWWKGFGVETFILKFKYNNNTFRKI